MAGNRDQVRPGRKGISTFRGALLLATVVLTLGTAGVSIPYLRLPDPVPLRERNPETTAYIDQKCSRSCVLDWTPLPEISSFMKRSVVIAEDSGFYRHGAVSVPTVWQALKRNVRERRLVWGASTITMQLARNLYLYPDKTVRRKLLEVLLAFKLERALTKNRILEIYLNVAEWGPGVFGITAASRHHFDKPPSEIGPLEASFLASILPLPARSGEDAWRSRFRDKGAIIFDRLVRPYLPKPDNGNEVLDPCDDRLDEDEAHRVDILAADLISRFGVPIASGDGGLLTRERIEGVLTEDQNRFLMELIRRFDNGRPPLSCRRRSPGEETDLVAWSQEEGSTTDRFWVPASAGPALGRLMVRAEEDGISLRLRSAYRASGYQIFLILRELRLHDYCLSKARKMVESPDRSEHSCLDTGALDFGSPEEARGTFADTEAYRWLRENAPAFGFHLSYDRDNGRGIAFEPWHWRYDPDNIPCSGRLWCQTQ
jgi:monofunctional biosynthetic peptidoglycan transglycosylase